MRAAFILGAEVGNVTFFRQSGDKKVYGAGWRADHTLMHHIKVWLNERGFHVIKKRMSDDGHLYGDTETPYICMPKQQTKSQLATPQIMIYDGNYAVRLANESWNELNQVAYLCGHAHLPGDKRYQDDWYERIFELGERHDDVEVTLHGAAKYFHDGLSAGLVQFLEGTTFETIGAALERGRPDVGTFRELDAWCGRLGKGASCATLLQQKRAKAKK